MKTKSIYRISSNSTLLKLREEQIFYSRSAGELGRPNRPFKLIDLFCGAGGMTLGFTEAFGHHFEPIWANDYNDYCVETYKANFGDHCFGGDIVDLLSDKKVKIPQADVVIGGPPCQGFSLLNKNRDNDPRRQLWRPFLEVVRRSSAKVFVIENVPQLLGTLEHEQIVETASALGFQVSSAKLLAADYGVPQTRTRAIIIGTKKVNPANIFPPRKTHFNPASNGAAQGDLDFSGNESYLTSPKPWRTVRDVIADLPDPIGTEIRSDKAPLNLHFGRTPTAMSLERYRSIPREGMNRFDLLRNAPDITPECWKRKVSGGTDLFGRLWWDKPSVTIRTEFYKPEKGRYLHPQKHRPITHREAARFQSFPDSFIFKGSKIEVAKQIGNAVPPLLASRIADVVLTLLTSED